MINSLAQLRARLWGSSGQAMPEYAVIAGAIVVAAYLGFRAVGNDVNTLVRSVLVAF